jgi:hypothetical protein
LFPALAGFFLRKEFKVRTSIIFALALFLFIVGYFLYIVLCISSIFMIMGLLFSLLNEDENTPSVQNANNKGDLE